MKMRWRALLGGPISLGRFQREERGLGKEGTGWEGREETKEGSVCIRFPVPQTNQVAVWNIGL